MADNKMKEGYDLDRFEGCFFQDVVEDYKNFNIHSFIFQQKLDELRCNVQERRKGVKGGSGKASILEKAKDLLLSKRPELKQEENRGEYYRCLWEILNADAGKSPRVEWFDEFWLNDCALQDGHISKEEYFIWLLQYITTHEEHYEDAFFRENFGRSGDSPELINEEDLTKYAPFPPQSGRKHPARVRKPYDWLKKMIDSGIGWNREEREAFWAENPTDADKNPESAKIKEGLKIIASILEQGGDDSLELLQRLVKFRYKISGIGQESDSLFFLTVRFRILAVHRKVSQFFRDSGYPLNLKEEKGKGKPERNKNKHVKMIDAYFCDYERGQYTFCEKGADHSRMLKNGIFELVGEGERQEVEKLRNAINHQEGYEGQPFIPLAYDSVSGCIFAMVGKENYRALYYHADLKDQKAYENATQNCCYDFLFLNAAQIQAKPYLPGAAYQLYPRFLLNCGMGYKEAFTEFKNYCIVSTYWEKIARNLPQWWTQRKEIISGPPREAIADLNQKMPEFDGRTELFRPYFSQKD